MYVVHKIDKILHKKMNKKTHDFKENHKTTAPT